MDNLSFRDEVLRELTTTMDQLLEAINGGVQYRMKTKKEVKMDCDSRGEQKEKSLEALHQAQFQKIKGEFLAGYDSRDTEAVMEAIRKLEETNKIRRKASQDGEKRRQILEQILVDLVRKIRKRRNPQVAKNLMLMLIEQSDRRHELHQELLAKYNNRSPHLSMEVIRKLEEENDIKRKASQNEESRRQILQNVLMDLVGRTNRAKEKPPVSQIMGMMLEHHRKRQKVHQELMMKLLQKELLGIRRRALQMEIMKKVEEREKRVYARKRMHQELIMKLLQKELMGIRRCVLQMEMMIDQSEKPEDDDDFLPRKLFVFGISSFLCQQKPSNSYSSTNLYEEIDSCNYQKEESEESKCYCEVKPKAKSLKSRLRKFLGLK